MEDEDIAPNTYSWSSRASTQYSSILYRHDSLPLPTWSAVPLFLTQYPRLPFCVLICLNICFSLQPCVPARKSQGLLSASICVCLAVGDEAASELPGCSPAAVPLPGRDGESTHQCNVLKGIVAWDFLGQGLSATPGVILKYVSCYMAPSKNGPNFLWHLESRHQMTVLSIWKFLHLESRRKTFFGS